MNYQECRAYIDDSAKYGSVLGLDNMREMLDRLGNPQDAVPYVHVAGTNGKGSVIAYLYTTLTRSKSSPLEIICVPIRISVFPSSKSLMMRS